MDTLVTIYVAVPPQQAPAWHDRVGRAFRWFDEVEARCSRFEPTSEVAGLTRQVGRPVRVSALLFEATRLALAFAEMTGGAFDPTVGHRLEASGFDRSYRTGKRWRSGVPVDARPTHRDVVVDPAGRTVTLLRPLMLDLGGLAKGLAVDLAVRELADAPGALVNAGGDVYAHRTDQGGRAWRIGVADPARPGGVLGTLEIADAAVATSGAYGRGAHIVDPRPRAPSGGQAATVTVVSPQAVVADVLSTAATVLGVTAGRALLEGVDDAEGLLISRAGEFSTTPGFTLHPVDRRETGRS